MQTVQCSRSCAGSVCTLRYDGAGFLGSTWDDCGALLGGMSGWPILTMLVVFCLVEALQCQICGRC